MTRSIRGSGRAAMLLAGTAAATSLLLSGCGAGQIAETANKIPSVQGVNVQTSDNLYKVRGLYVRYPGVDGYQADANAPLNVVIYNDSPTPVTVTVTTDGARDIVLAGSTPGGAEATPSASATEQATATPSPAGTPSAAATATPSASPSESAPAGRPARIEIPPLSYAQLNADGPQFLQLVGLKDKLFAGQQVNLTFDFGDGKVIRTAAPIGVPLTPNAPASPVVHPREDAGAEGGSHG